MADNENGDKHVGYCWPHSRSHICGRLNQYQYCRHSSTNPVIDYEAEGGAVTTSENKHSLMSFAQWTVMCLLCD
jgi:hypothetical protein